MLVAWDSETERACALPDYEETNQLEELRKRTRAGILQCPTCHQALLLRAGEIRCAHFAHRVLADCPSTHVSLAILETRRLIYLFFRDRIESGKLPGSIELEPISKDLPHKLRIDLLLHRHGKPAVAIVLLERSVKPDARWALRSSFGREDMIVRTVFLQSTLKRQEGAGDVFLLTSTQRELAHQSRFGGEEDPCDTNSSLHFVDHVSATWTSVRGLRLRHPPQAYGAGAVPRSKLSELLWSEGSAEWTHRGETRAKPVATTLATGSLNSQKLNAEAKGRPPPARATPPPPEIPAWISDGLICKGCQVRTLDWIQAKPLEGWCVCKACFAKGIPR